MGLRGVCMRTMYRLLRFAAVTLLSCLLLLAQLNRGSLTGTVTDNSGAVIPNVKLTIRNIATGAQYETVTNENGQYNEANLPIGEYVIVFESPNFKRVERKGVDLGVTQVLRVDATLEVGSVTESVSVTAETPRLQTDSPEVGTSLSNKQLIDLPLTFAGARHRRELCLPGDPRCIGQHLDQQHQRQHQLLERVAARRSHCHNLPRGPLQRVKRFGGSPSGVQDPDQRHVRRVRTRPSGCLQLRYEVRREPASWQCVWSAPE